MFGVPEELRGEFRGLVAELVEWRLAAYLSRSGADAAGSVDEGGADGPWSRTAVPPPPSRGRAAGDHLLHRPAEAVRGAEGDWIDPYLGWGAALAGTAVRCAPPVTVPPGRASP
jgi:hypothetical protein